MRESGTGLLLRPAVSRVLSPELALALVRELCCDVVAAELRAADASDGERLAGEDVGGAQAMRLRDGGVEMALSLGPQAMPALVRHDAAMGLAALRRPEDRP
jgi:hypothetical protein